MNDLIDRRVAIDLMGVEPLAFSEYENGLHDKWEDDVEALMKLPPAQLEIIRCKDCKYYKTMFCAMDTWTAEITIYKAQPDDFCSRAER